MFPVVQSYRYDTATSAWTIDAPEEGESLMFGLSAGQGTRTGLATNSPELLEGDDK